MKNFSLSEQIQQQPVKPFLIALTDLQVIKRKIADIVLLQHSLNSVDFVG
jgi:hypothetical protein